MSDKARTFYMDKCYGNPHPPPELKEIKAIKSASYGRSILPYPVRRIIGIADENNPYDFIRHRKAWSIRRVGAADILARNHGYRIIWA